MSVNGLQIPITELGGQQCLQQFDSFPAFGARASPSRPRKATALMSPAFEEAAAFRFGFRRGALAFWLASLVGFVAWGHLVACMFVDAMPESPAPLGESGGAAGAVGLAGA